MDKELQVYEREEISLVVILLFNSNTRFFSSYKFMKFSMNIRL